MSGMLLLRWLDAALLKVKEHWHCEAIPMLYSLIFFSVIMSLPLDLRAPDTSITVKAGIVITRIGFHWKRIFQSQITNRWRNITFRKFRVQFCSGGFFSVMSLCPFYHLNARSLANTQKMPHCLMPLKSTPGLRVNIGWQFDIQISGLLCPALVPGDGFYLMLGCGDQLTRGAGCISRTVFQHQHYFVCGLLKWS